MQKRDHSHLLQLLAMISAIQHITAYIISFLSLWQISCISLESPHSVFMWHLNVLRDKLKLKLWSSPYKSSMSLYFSYRMIQ